MLGIRSTISSLREYLTPVSHVSTFRETGEITPEEFVIAGDHLIYKFPTWEWLDVPESKRKDFLPSDKQVLVTKHLPSYRRANDLTNNNIAETFLGDNENISIDNDEDGWTKMDSIMGYTNISNSNNNSNSNNKNKNIKQIPEEIPDEDEDNEDDDEDEDDIVFQNNLRRPSRTYDLYIMYSTSYRVPKMYLSGSDASGSPLTAAQMVEDIIGEYKDKTVTIEKAPFLEDQTMISIHPCKHSSVMRLLLSRAESNSRSIWEKKQKNKSALKSDKCSTSTSNKINDDLNNLNLHDEHDWEEITDDQYGPAIPVEHYMIYFLKFISSVTPGIEHDYTISAV